MLTKRIIPCLDVKDGRVVKGVRFSNLRDLGDPVELALRYEAEGADELILLDISATVEGRISHLNTIAAVRKRLSIPLTTGGGISLAEDARRLLEAGADKVSINSAAVIRPDLIAEIARLYGSQCTVVAIDACRNSLGWHILIRSGQEATSIDAVQWAKEAVGLGAGEILLTSWDRDGTGQGYDLELIREISANVSVPVIASGGAKNPEHLLSGLRAGADAVLAASIFHEGSYSISEVKKSLRLNKVEIRL